jgi:hypothetical protein
MVNVITCLFCLRMCSASYISTTEFFYHLDTELAYYDVLTNDAHFMVYPYVWEHQFSRKKTI